MVAKTRADLKTGKNTTFADNVSGDISEGDMRNEFEHVIDSAILSEDIDTIAELNAIVADATILVSGGALGTPASGVATNLTGTAAGLTAGNVTTNANLTGHITSSGNAAILGSFSLAQLNAAISDGTVQVQPAEGAFVDGDKTALDATLTAATLAATTTGAGASLIGIEDVGTYYTGLNVEAALSEIGALLPAEANADVTDTANVTSAGALMDSEVDADIKTLVLPANTTISAFGATVIDDANQTAAQTTLGVDPAGTDNSTDVTLAGTPDYITISGQVITRNAVDLAADVTGNLPVGNLNGGTAASSSTWWRGDGTWAAPAADALTSNPLSQFAATTSAQLAGVLSDETGSGASVFGTSPTISTPVLTLAQGLTPTPTAEGRIEWDTDNNQIKVGDGTGTVTFSEDGALATSAQGALADSALQPGGALGTPSSGVATNLTGTAAGLTAGTVTTNANLTGHVTSTGNAAVLGSFSLAQLNTAISDGTVQVQPSEGAFVDGDKTKLDGIETGATADQTGAQIKTAYEAEADTNAFTDADHTKLDGIEASADVTDATNVAAAGASITTSGAGAPVSTPAAVGDTYIDTTGDIAYVATATVSSADWDAVVISGGALGTPASGTATNLTGTAAGLTAGNVTTNANLTGHITSVGNAAVLGSFSTAQLNAAISDGTINTPEGTAVLSTGEAGGTKFLREDGDGTCSWQTIAGGGDALTSSPLSQFAATTSAQLAGVLTDETGTGSFVCATSPTLVTPALGTPASGVLTNATGLPIATGVSGLGTGVATALAVNVGSAGAPVTNGGALGTPSSGTLTSATGLPIVAGTTGTLSVARGGTGVTTSTGTGNVVRSASPTFTGTPVLPSTITLGANSFIRSGAHNLTLTTSGVTNVTLPTTGTVVTLAGTETLTNKTLTDAKITHTVNAQTGTTYTLVLTDQTKVITMSNASANTLTIPTNASVAFPTGSMIEIIMKGAGATTVDGAAGVTVNGVSGGGAAISAQYSGVTIRKIATNEWIMTGNHGTVA